jgi:spermidine synthase
MLPRIRILPLLLLLCCYPWPAGAENIIHNERSLYRNITVYESNNERCMRFTRAITSRQSCLALDDPHHLIFNYTKMIMAALYLNPEPKKILIIGLGGGTLPMTFSRIIPRAEIDTVEIDPAVVRVARKYFNFQKSAKNRVAEDDGRVFVKRAILKKVKYDLIILDAYDHEYIPEHLLTREFLSEVKKIMEPGAVLAANTWSGSRLYDHESATYESVFGRFFNLKCGSRVIIIKQDGLPALETIKKNARQLERKIKPLGVSSSFLLPLFSTKRDWPPDARILTDQYSPSNLLNALSGKTN